MEEKILNVLDIKDGVDAILPGTRLPLNREGRNIFGDIPSFLNPMMCDIDDDGAIIVGAKEREIPDEVDYDFFCVENKRAVSYHRYPYRIEDINIIITKMGEFVDSVGSIYTNGIPSTIVNYIITLVGKLNRAYGIEYDNDGDKVSPVVKWNEPAAPVDYLKLAHLISDKRLYGNLVGERVITEFIANVLYMFTEDEIVERYGGHVYKRIVSLWMKGGARTDMVKRSAHAIYERHGKAMFDLHVFYMENMADDNLDVKMLVKFCEEVRNVETIMRLIRCDDVLNGINALMTFFDRDEYLSSIMPYRKEINTNIRENPVEFFELNIIPTDYDKCKEVAPWVDRLTWISVNCTVIDFEKEMKETTINVHEEIVPYVFAVANYVSNFYDPESDSLSKEACEDYLDSMLNFINAISSNSSETTLVSMTFSTAMAKMAVKLNDFTVLNKLENGKFFMDLVYVLNGKKYREALLNGVTEDIVRRLILDDGISWGGMVANAMYFPKLYMEFTDDIINSSNIEVFGRGKFYVETGVMNWTEYLKLIEKLPPAMVKMIDYDPRFLCFLLESERMNFKEIFDKYYSVENVASFIEAFGLIAFLNNRSLTVREIFKSVDINRDFIAFMEIFNRYIDVLLTTQDDEVRSLLIGSFGCIIYDDHRNAILDYIERYVMNPEIRYVLTDDDKDSVLFALSHKLEDGKIVPIKNREVIARCAELCSWNTVSGVRVKGLMGGKYND